MKKIITKMPHILCTKSLKSSVDFGLRAPRSELAAFQLSKSHLWTAQVNGNSRAWETKFMGSV